MNLSQVIKSSTTPFVIAGPCSIESENQLYSVTQSLCKIDAVQYIRAGVWKPRTRPNSFEGIGEIGLEWIQSVKKEFSKPFCIEVANPKHIELALKANVDALWIGARTTVNPFAIQDIVDSLRGVKIPILIKNPINPDVNLWIGAFERFMKADLFDLTAIHRGFSVYNHPKYRNVPNWEIPIAIKEHFPQIPIICDPSHITGNRMLIQEVSQNALDLNFDGLMIEVSPDPDKALSDANQQITPETLITILNQLILRTSSVQQFEIQLSNYREQLKSIDDGIFDLLAKRMSICDDLGDFKRDKNLPILDVNQWMKILQERLNSSPKSGLSTPFIRKIMDAIHQESIQHQNKAMNEL
jgi:chorismate mutase